MNPTLLKEYNEIKAKLEAERRDKSGMASYGDHALDGRFKCQECGNIIPKRSHRCRKCGSYDIDLA